MSKEWFVMEWCPLDNDIDLYRCRTRSSDLGEAWEDIEAVLHNFSSVLVMDSERFSNLCKAVESVKRAVTDEAKKRNLKKKVKGGVPE